MATESTEAVVEGAAAGLLRLFDLHDVEYFFNSPGSEDGPIWEAFARSREVGDGPTVTHLNCRHESVAVTMATGYAMLTGRPQVVKLHVNVGPLHAAMELFGAGHSRAPMLVIGSYNRTHEGEQLGGTAGPHYLNYQQPGGHENNFSRYVKWVGRVETNDNLERFVDRAFRIAASFPAGPVVATIPQELLYDPEKRRVSLERTRPARTPAVDTETLDEIATKLDRAHNPLLITGSIGRRPAAVSSLVALAERLQLPVFENQKVHFNFPMDHPLYLGASTGTAATPQPYFAADFDLVLVLDSAEPWYPPVGGAPDAEIVMVHPEPVQEKRAYWNYPADVLVGADAGRLLPHLLDRVSEYQGSRPEAWSRVHDAWERRWDARATEGRDSTPIDPFWLCQQLDSGLPDDAIVCNETIVHGSIVANLIRDHGERRYLEASRTAAGGLGTGIGLTLGAKLAEPHRPAVLLVGDGSFHYNPVTAAYGAAHEHDLPLLTVVFNNGGYQSMRGALEAGFPVGAAQRREDYVGSPITPSPAYHEEMAKWGGHGERVEDSAEVGPAIERGLDALAEGSLALLDVRLASDVPAIPAHSL